MARPSLVAVLYSKKRRIGMLPHPLAIHLFKWMPPEKKMSISFHRECSQGHSLSGARRGRIFPPALWFSNTHPAKQDVLPP